MNSAALRLVLVVLGWPLAVLALLSLFIWYQDARDREAVPPPNLARVQHPVYHPLALKALDLFATLTPARRGAIIERLGRGLIPLAEWWPVLRQSGYQLICLGENHDEDTRTYLATSMLRELDIDILFLEATAAELRPIMARTDEGEPYVPLLDANIAPLIRAARARNPALAIKGIEETPATRAARQMSKQGSREASIAANLWPHFRPGQRHAILYGALHCADQPDWLFAKLRARLPGPKLRGVRVLGEHQDGPLEAFIYFLDEIGLKPGNFVIPRTDRLPPEIKAWFSFLNQATLSRFQTVVVYRPPREP